MGNLTEGTHLDVTGQVVYTAISLVSIMVLTVLLSEYIVTRSTPVFVL